LQNSISEFKQTFGDILRNIQLLADLNGGRTLPGLQLQQSNLEQRLGQLQELVTSLARKSLEFATERDQLDSSIQTVVHSVSDCLEKARELNNVLGEDNDISARLVAAQVSRGFEQLEQLIKAN
jgi:chromosome segregation ATPase